MNVLGYLQCAFGEWDLGIGGSLGGEHISLGLGCGNNIAFVIAVVFGMVKGAL